MDHINWVFSKSKYTVPLSSVLSLIFIPFQLGNCIRICRQFGSSTRCGHSIWSRPPFAEEPKMADICTLPGWHSTTSGPSLQPAPTKKRPGRVPLSWPWTTCSYHPAMFITTTRRPFRWSGSWTMPAIRSQAKKGSSSGTFYRCTRSPTPSVVWASFSARPSRLKEYRCIWHSIDCEMPARTFLPTSRCLDQMRVVWICSRIPITSWWIFYAISNNVSIISTFYQFGNGLWSLTVVPC